MGKAQDKLVNYCAWDWTKDAIKALNTSHDIDLNDDNGIVFRLAIKHNNTALLDALLKYYEEHKPEDRESPEYKHYIGKFHKTFTEVIRSFTNEFTGEYTFSKEIESVLTPYLGDEEDKDEEALAPNVITKSYVPIHEDYASQVSVDWPDSLKHASTMTGEGSVASDCDSF